MFFNAYTYRFSFPFLKNQQNPILKYILLVAVSLSQSWLPFSLTESSTVGGEGNVGEFITPEVNPGLGGHRHTMTCGLQLKEGFSWALGRDSQESNKADLWERVLAK